MKREGEVGYSTNGYRVIDYLLDNNIRMDKILMFTDMQMWDTCNDKHINESWQKYRQMYPDARLYLFDLAGYGTNPVDMTDDNTFLIGGWSDKVFKILEAIENGADAISEIHSIDI